jgi:hypothetical protein
MAVPADLAFHPITVEMAGRLRTVNTVRDAARLLLTWPPEKRGDAWRTACAACHAALAGTLEPETAGKAFLKAAIVAGIYVKEADGRR